MKKYIIAVMMLIMVLSGCSTPSIEETKINQVEDKIVQQQPDTTAIKDILEKSKAETEAYSSENKDAIEEVNTDFQDLGDYDEDYEQVALTFEEYMGNDIEQLTDVQISEAKKRYQAIIDYSISEDYDEEVYMEMFDEFDEILRGYGIVVPYYSLNSFLNTITNMDKKDYDTLVKNEDAIYKMIVEAQETGGLNQLLEDETFLKLEASSKAIFEKYGFNYEEVMMQIDNQNAQLALFDIKNSGIILSKDSILKVDQIGKDKILLYKNIFAKIVAVVPEKYMNMITAFEVNTDGVDFVLAHVNPETEDMSKWRLAIDIKDSIDDENQLTDEFMKTIIHEMAHVMTLNKEQMLNESEVEKSNTYTTDEGTLKKDSYLNRFFDQFWKDIYEEYININKENQEYEGEAMYEFYEKYKDQFVSDYAATNPEEDIAESFRVFVYQKEPTGDTIADKKVKFFYQFEEMVKYRQDIRTKLGIK